MKLKIKNTVFTMAQKTLKYLDVSNKICTEF